MHGGAGAHSTSRTMDGGEADDRPVDSRVAMSSAGGMTSTPPAKEQSMFQLKKKLLLLATLVATVTYAAGLNLPGGTWLEDAPAAGQVAGDSILRETSYGRYIVFYYFNAISFAASLLVSLLLLLVHKDGDQAWLLLLMRSVMAVDLLGLMGAYAVGASHDRFTTACSSVLVSGVVAFLAYVTVLRIIDGGGGDRAQAQQPPPSKLETEHENLLVLAIFAATIAFVAGLNPPGGFWRSTEAGGHVVAGDPVLQGLHPGRYRAFFFCNTTAFVGSLLAIMLIVDYEKLDLRRSRPVRGLLYVITVTALLGLVGAYAAGSCRDGSHTAYVLGLVAPVLACFLIIPPGLLRSTIQCIKRKCPDWLISPPPEELKRTREYIQLLATLAATIAYQAGLDPPGGVWSDTGDGHRVGDPILLTTHPGRYKVFFYFNSAAFVASLVIMAMLQNELLLRRHALEAAVILDLFGLIGAYAAGSCRDTSTSIYMVALAGAVLIYVVIHIAFFTLDDPTKMTTSAAAAGDDDSGLEMKREVLLLLAILAATLTYQAGLTPPGGFWENDDDRSAAAAGHHHNHPHHAGFPVLQDKYPLRYKAFAYCNAASFMASVALIVLLLNKNLYKPGIHCYALIVCMAAGMFGLMGAYAAGSSLHLRTSIIVLVLVAVLAVAVLATGVYVLVTLYRERNNPATTPRTTQDQEEQEEQASTSTQETVQYLMLVGILAASVTYVTGLKPPGGLWRDDHGGHSAGNPVLYDVDERRYNVFFYSNSVSFMASITVIVLLLSRMRMSTESKAHLWRMHTVMLLDMVALMVAYAAGSAREWSTSWKVILMLLPILSFFVILFFVKLLIAKAEAKAKEKGKEEEISGQSILLAQAGDA